MLGERHCRADFDRGHDRRHLVHGCADVDTASDDDLHLDYVVVVHDGLGRHDLPTPGN
ncbi:MAG: hypothetical protein AB7R77_16210 [Ilumatobacteraceae bacterium]